MGGCCGRLNDDGPSKRRALNRQQRARTSLGLVNIRKSLGLVNIYVCTAMGESDRSH